MTARLRCAIYTRKSTDEGLDQSFNSLDAQREACEAYILSQAGEGWRALADRYDDGGYSGGNLNRPAMQQLLADVDAGKVDIIIVYKVDRLTRSLIDFAKIVDRLDARGVSFVSRTQAFNTTTSMGRLTLNVLLSFAQFEREVTGERIRDKIAASKAKGMWMGGNVPLGYDLGDRRLTVNPAEAELVRHIFERYLALGSGVALAKELRRDGILSKRWVARSGQAKGGTTFSCGALYYLLQNRLYLGEITHRGTVHVGEHDAIVGQGLFDGVQKALADRRQARKSRPGRATNFQLAGLVIDPEGRPMTTTFSYGRGGRQYRYYVSGSLDPLRTEPRPSRVPAAPLEKLIFATVGKLQCANVTFTEVLAIIKSVKLLERSIQVILNTEVLLEPHECPQAAIPRLQPLLGADRLVREGSKLTLVIDRQPIFRGGKTDRGRAGLSHSGDGTKLLRQAHQLLELHSMSPLEPGHHRSATAPVWQRQRRIMMLGLLSPTVQRAITKGVFESLEELLSKHHSLAWADQTAF